MASRQHEVIATWQLRAHGLSEYEAREGMRGLRRIHRGVCATGDLTELGWYMAAALAMGPTGRVSHLSALQLMGLRPYKPGDIHVSHAGGGRAQRDGLTLHRRADLEHWTYKGVPVTNPTQSLKDADLRPHQLYRAIEEAEKRRYDVTLPPNDVARLKRTVKGFTRSDSEALFLWLCHTNDLPLPLVNQQLNGFETDFHWPELRLVVEVDGWEHHRERPQFNNDRLRGLVHRANGWEVMRISADHVHDAPQLILAALTAAEMASAA